MVTYSQYLYSAYNVPGTFWASLKVWICWIYLTVLGGSPDYCSILQMKKLKHRKGKQFSQGHMANEWQS